MNMFWLKMVGFAVAVVGIIILINVFSSSEPEPKQKQKGFYDVIEQDDKRLRAEPETETPSVGIESTEPKFRELSEEEQVQAEKLFEMALMHRKMGRLPGMSYKLMVDYCRQIIEKYPGSIYAFKAKRILADIPQRYREQYNITEQEMKGD